MSFMDSLIEDLKSSGIKPDLLQKGNEQLGSDLAMPCFAMAKELKKNPNDIAVELAKKIDHPMVQKAEAVSGYLNIWLTDQAQAIQLEEIFQLPQIYQDQTIVCEYSDPNPFKVLHVGHLYTSVIGDAIANLFELLGANVKRVNFGGDVGLHVAKSMWGVINNLGGEYPNKLTDIPLDQRSDWMSDRYVEGNKAYEDENEKSTIIELNKRIYQIHEQNDHDSSFANIYWQLRQWSYDYFEEFYTKIGTTFDKYYPESATASIGLEAVKNELATGVFEESDGAVIFPGEKHGLHNRVFINSDGLPTYEAKDIGLILAKNKDYNFDKSVVITGNDIIEYMKVVLKSVEQFEPELSDRTVHITHGMVKPKSGIKMSSRLGNIIKATDVLESVDKINISNDWQVTLASVKYSFLKQSIGGDVHFDPQESVAISGNSGPYLQYAYARANSISTKSNVVAVKPEQLDNNERLLVQYMNQFPSSIKESIDEFSPSKLCNYLYTLTQNFNRFYESSQVVGSEREAERIYLLHKYKQILKTGLDVLGIKALDKM